MVEQKKPDMSSLKSSAYMLLVFDWDGTLIDSEGKIIFAFHAACDDLAVSRRSAEDIRNVIGLGLPIAIRSIFPECDSQQMMGKIQEQYRYHFAAAASAELFPGVRETLVKLREAGFLMAVATGKSRRGLNDDLLSTGLWEMFDATRCADEAPSKPHPQMLQEICEELQVAAKNTLMIGDTEHDLKMAQNAGVDAVAVTYGAQSQDYLQQWKPRIFCDSLPELITWLVR